MFTASGPTGTYVTYKNGASVASATIAGTSGGFTELTLGYNLANFSDARMMHVTYFKGTVIDATQVAALYNSGTPPLYGTLPYSGIACFTNESIERY